MRIKSTILIMIAVLTGLLGSTGLAGPNLTGAAQMVFVICCILLLALLVRSGR